MACLLVGRIGGIRAVNASCIQHRRSVSKMWYREKSLCPLMGCRPFDIQDFHNTEVPPFETIRSIQEELKLDHNQKIHI